ncbi:MAG: DUF2244 domain-containing protein [Acetobacteraceae bacterium]|nr:DUF2244 domain-containing protein [Pseudomonadota bacterium]
MALLVCTVMMDGHGVADPVHGSASGDTPQTVFEAVIVPHQSLNRRGLIILGVCLVAISAGVSLRFMLMGAWPVMVFSGAEILVAVLLLLTHRRQARRTEIIRLNEAEITIVRTDAKGRRRSFSLPSAWLQVRLEEPPKGGGTRLWLRSHGRLWEVGAFLHDPERRSLFEALKDALHDLRNPQFHNEQLLEC